MARVNYHDVLHEMIELSTEVMREIRHQLFYYNASVYKNDLAYNIKRKVENLRLVIELSGQDELIEFFRDHDAMLNSGHFQEAPGECAFAARTTILVSGLDAAIKEFDALLKSKNRVRVDTRDLSKKLYRHRRDLIAICKHGSRHRAFFQSI
ncbi:hypothetical protein N9D31_00795 [Oligoflexaceae bacterium]|nr:hypothetical protein [Oligoflexaceae bacterium]